MKSIISRYGELTKDPSQLQDSEGEAMSFNKVDKALQSVGISMHDANGEFKDADEVLGELAKKWDSLDGLSQRYIATQLAGNRQQSRLLAYLSNYERYAELQEEAANAEGKAQLQVLKTMDSVAAKQQQLTTSWQTLYTESGVENLYKGILDVVAKVVDYFSGLPKLFDKIPVTAVAVLSQIVATIVSLVKTLLANITTYIHKQINEVTVLRDKAAAEAMAKEQSNEQQKESVHAQETASVQNNLNAQTAATQDAMKQQELVVYTSYEARVKAFINMLKQQQAAYDSVMGRRGTVYTEPGLNSYKLPPPMPSRATNWYVSPSGNVLYPNSNLGAMGLTRYIHYNRVQQPGPTYYAPPTSQPTPLLTSGGTYETVFGADPAKNSVFSGFSKIISKAKTSVSGWMSSLKQNTTAMSNLTIGMRSVGMAMQMWSMALSDQKDSIFSGKTWLNAGGGALSSIGFFLSGNPVLGALTALTTVIQFIDNVIESTEEKVERLSNDVEDARNEAAISKDEVDSLKDYQKKYKELYKERNRDEESQKNWIDLNNEIADKYPELIKHMDSEGNYLVDMTSAYDNLLQAKQAAYSEDFVAKVRAELEAYKDLDYVLSTIYDKDLIGSDTWSRWTKGNAGSLRDLSERSAFGETLTLDDFSEIFQFKDKNHGWADKKDTLFSVFDIADAEWGPIHQFQDSYDEELNNALVRTGVFSKRIYQGVLSLGGNYYQDVTSTKPLGEIASAYNDAAQQGLSFAEAQKQVVEALNKVNPDLATIAKTFNEVVYSEMLAAAQTGQFYSELYDNQIHTFNAEWVNNQIGISGLNANDLQKAAILRYTDKAWKDYKYDKNGNLTEEYTEALKQKTDEGEDYTEADVFTDWLQSTITPAAINKAIGEEGGLKFLDDTEINELYQESGQYSRANYRKQIEALGYKTGSEAQNIQVAAPLLNSVVLDTNQYPQIEQEVSAEAKELLDQYEEDYAEDYELFYQGIEDRFEERKNTGILPPEWQPEAAYSLFKGENVIAPDLIPQVRDQLYAIMDNSALSIEQWDEQVTDLLMLYNETSDIAEPEDAAKIQAKLANADLTSLFGVWTAIADISDLELTEEWDPQALIDLGSHLVVNVQTEIDSYTTELTKHMEDFEKDVKGVSEGMDFKDASELAQKIGKEMTDFEFKDGKFFFEDYDVLRTEILKENEGYIKALKDKQAQQAKPGSKEWVDIDKEIEAVNNYADYVVAQAQITTGDYEAFLNMLGLKEGQVNYELENIQKQNWAALAQNELIRPYINLLYNTVKDINSNFYSSLIDGIENEGTVIQITDATKELAAQFGQSIQGTNGKWTWQANNDNGIKAVVDENTGEILQLIIDEESLQIEGTYDAIKAAILSDQSLASEEQKSLLSKLHETQFLHNQTDAVEKLSESYENFTYDEGIELFQALGQSVEQADQSLQNDPTIRQNADGTYAFTTAQAAIDFVTKLREVVDGAGVDLQSANDALAKIESTAKSTVTTGQINGSVLHDILGNWEDLSEENIADLATMLGWDYTEVQTLMTKEAADGSRYFDVSALYESLWTVPQEYQKVLFDAFYQINDSILEQLGDLSSKQSEGFTSFQEMNEIKTKINNLTGQTYDIDDLFEFNEITGAYELTKEGIQQQVQTLLQQIPGATQEEALELVKQTTRGFAENINVVDFATSMGEGQIWDETEDAIQDYLDALSAFGQENGIFIDGARQTAKSIMDILREGGSEATLLAQELSKAAGKELSEDEIRSVYQAQTEKLGVAFEEMGWSVGSVVNELTAELIGGKEFVQVMNENGQYEQIERYGGIYAKQIGETGQYIITQAVDFGTAYKRYYDQLRETGEATLEQLNNATAEVLKHSDKRDQQQDAIDAIGDAMGMNFERLAEIFTQQGIELTTELYSQLEEQGIFEDVGGNKIRITDFKGFASLMGWEPDSEEYTSAFKTYNDELIDLNRKAERNIVEEVQALEEAKPGDMINLTQLTSKLDDAIGKWVTADHELTNEPLTFFATPLEALQQDLAGYGGALQDGILELKEGANLPAIIQTITDYATEYGGLLSSDIAQLSDTLHDTLDTYIDILRSGIEGNLSNVERLDLITFAKNSLGLDISELDFSETAEGLKLSRDAAWDLYVALEQVDHMRATLLFDDMADFITDDLGSGADNMADIMATITEKQKEIADNEKQINALNQQVRDAGLTKTEESRLAALRAQNKELQKQVDMYGQIANRQMNNPDSYDFMNGKLPTYLQGAANYWNSVGSAYKTMNESAKSGYMDFTDYYNIVTELSNLAAMSGNMVVAGQQFESSAEMASFLIEKGAAALSNIDGEGVKVKLANLGIDFVTGADSMKSNFQDGIKALAKSQIEMLDAAIQLLETIVAMEELGDIDVDQDNQLELGEIFNTDGITNPDNIDEWTESYHQWSASMEKKLEADDDLAKGFESVSINGHTLREYVTAAADEVGGVSEDMERLGLTTEQYQQVMNGFYQALVSGDYDLETVTESVWEILESTLPDGTVIDVGSRSIVITGGTRYTLNWESEEAQEVLEELGGDNEENRNNVIEAFKRYQAGEASEIDLETVYRVNGIMNKIETEDGAVQWEVDGQTYTDEKKAILASGLVDQGVSTTGIKFDYDETGEPISATVTQTMGKIQYKVKNSGDGKVTYTYTGHKGTIEAPTRKELIDKIIEDTQQSERELGRKVRSEEEIRLALELPFTIDPTYTVTGDPTQLAPEELTSLREFINFNTGQFAEHVSAQVQNRDEGDTIVIDYGPLHFEVISTGDPTVDTANITDAAISNLGLDPLITAITTAITNTLTNQETVNKISAAFVTGIQTAIQNGENQANTEGTTTPLEFKLTADKVTITADEYEFGSDIQEGAEQAMPKLQSFEGEVEEMKLTPLSTTVEPAAIEGQAVLPLIPMMMANVYMLAVNSVGMVRLNEDMLNVNIMPVLSNLVVNVNELDVASISSIVLNSELVLEATGWDISVASANATIEDLSVASITSSHYDSTLELTSPIENGKATISNMVVGAQMLTADTGLAQLQGMSFAQTNQSLMTIQTRTNSISNKTFSNFGTLSETLSTIKTQVDGIWETVQQFANQTFTVTLNSNGGDSETNTTTNETTNSVTNITTNESLNVDTSVATKALKALSQMCDTLGGAASNAATRVSKLSEQIGRIPEVSSRVSNLANAMYSIPSGRSTYVSNLASAMSDIPSVASRITGLNNALRNIPTSKSISVSATIAVSATGAGTVAGQSPGKNTKHSIFNVSYYANAKGKNTLIGELGPELVVSQGRYFLAGADGPEMISLADDAIVFNHKQTQDLLKHGKTTKRGDPVTNETNAISLATGNVEGPALASAKSALAALKALRAMWQSMLDASAKDLGAMAGSGGGGGGGGGGDPAHAHAVVEEIEQWYNLLRQIAKLEQQITYQESLQAKLLSDRTVDGYAVYDSYKQELKYLDAEIQRNQRLADLQKSYYDRAREELSNSAYGQIFTYDEDGLMQYVDGENRGLDLLKKLSERDVNGKPTGWAETAEKQLEYLDKFTEFDIKDLLWNDDGTQIAGMNAKGQLTNADTGEVLKDQELYDAQAAMMEVFWNNVQGKIDEMDSLYDSYNDQLENVLSNQEKLNEVLQKMIDNQIDIENKIVEAIEAREQERIDKATDVKEALQEASDKFIQGLSDQLEHEQQMYENTNNEKDLTKLQRQLGILQRSGGSQSQIQSLQEQIDNQQQQMYFDKQQQQIDAIQKASDAQIQRLDYQIQLMTETLEYQKENGLWWDEVSQLMQQRPQDVMNFLRDYLPEYQGKSETEILEELRQFKGSFETWVGMLHDSTFKDLTTEAESKFKELNPDFTMPDDVQQQARDAFDSTWESTGDLEQAKQAAQGVYDSYYEQYTAPPTTPPAPPEPTPEPAPEPAPQQPEQQQQQSKKRLSRAYAEAAIGFGVWNGWSSKDEYGTGGTRKARVQEVGLSYKNVQGYADRMKSIDKNVRWSKVKQWFKDNKGLDFDKVDKNIFSYTNLKRVMNKRGIEWYDTGGYTGEWGSEGKLGVLHEKELVLNKTDTAHTLEILKQTREIYRQFFQRSPTRQTFEALEEMSKKLSSQAGRYSTQVQQNSPIIIQEANVNMNVEEIANDYDARRAGESALDEIVKIARRTTNLSLSRR